jgi:hypothetical protein
MDGPLLSETFVELTDTMVAGFDVIDFLHVPTGRSVQLLDVSAAGLLLADPRRPLAPVCRRRPRRRVHRRAGFAHAAARAGHRRPDLFRAAPGSFDPAAVRVGQALADVTTISLLHERSMRRSDTLNEQLQTASGLARAFVDGTETLTGLTAIKPQRLPGTGPLPRQPWPGSRLTQ